MVEIYIPQRPKIEAHTGDLMMIVLYHNLNNYGGIDAFNIGVFEEIRRDVSGNPELLFDYSFLFKPAWKFGKTLIPQINPILDRYRTQLNSSIRDIYVGQDDIASNLEKTEGFEIYADIIRQLKRPYLELYSEERK